MRALESFKRIKIQKISLKYRVKKSKIKEVINKKSYIKHKISHKFLKNRLQNIIFTKK